ncbi:MAG: hypothetical protein K0R38_587 [Polyangiaceae bacterium]|jgi:hypothetical protein|nr:hypothetical protein [Polyangiaceae bacterium]
MTRWRIGLAVALAVGAGFTAGLQWSVEERARLLAALKQAREEVVHHTSDFATGGDEPARLGRNVSAGQLVTPLLQAGPGRATAEHCPSSAPDTVATPDASPLPEPDPRTQDNIDAFDQTLRVLDEAVRDKHWTDANASALHSLIPRLTQDDVFDLHQRFASAVNEGRLKVDVTQSPF